MLRGLPLGDPLDGIALHDLRKHGRTARVRWHEHAELPGNDLVEAAVSAEAFAHPVGEAGEFDAVGAHGADAARWAGRRVGKACVSTFSCRWSPNPSQKKH